MDDYDYLYQEHIREMVSNCCGCDVEEINDFCYICDSRVTNEVIDNGSFCEICKHETEVCEKYVCNSCNKVCQPIEDYEYTQIQIDERRDQNNDR